MFCPNGSSQSVAAVYQTPVLIPLTSVNVDDGAVRIAFTGNTVLTVAFGDSSIIADASDILVAAGATVFHVPSGSTHISLYVISSGTTVSVVTGQDI